VSLALKPRRDADLRCAICHDDAPEVSCACGTTYHAGCRAELGRGPTLGCLACANVRVRKVARPPRPLRFWQALLASLATMAWVRGSVGDASPWVVGVPLLVHGIAVPFVVARLRGASAGLAGFASILAPFMIGALIPGSMLLGYLAAFPVQALLGSEAASAVFFGGFWLAVGLGPAVAAWIAPRS
jgi:hypothetical protein